MAGRPGGSRGIPAPYSQGRIGLSLYDLKNDVGETTDCAAAHPEVVKRLQALAEQGRADLGDTLTQRQGTGIRPAGELGPDDERLRW